MSFGVSEILLVPAFGFGVPELLIILAIILVVFGANKLPGIGDALGKSIKNFKRATHGEDELEVGEGQSKPAVKSGEGRGQLEAKAVEVEDAEVVTASKKAD